MKSELHLFVLIFGGAAIFCFGSAIKILMSFSNLKKTGKTTLGKIIEVLDDFESERIVVSFYDSVGTSFTIISSSASSGYKNQIGKEVKVFYNPADPVKARVVSDVYAQTVVFLVIGFIFGAIGVIIAVD
jgi:exosome complex RNA-binding protein Csl4